MLKKLVATAAVAALFACSSDSGDDGTTTSSSSVTDGSSSSITDGLSSSSEDELSSSSAEPSEQSISIAAFNGSASELFNTYAYSYTIGEDLASFWDETIKGCEIPANGQNDDLKPSGALACNIDKENAILQNTITIQYSPLHYIIDGLRFGGTPALNKAIYLEDFNLRAVEGEDGEIQQQAALGLNVSSEDGTSIGELAKNDLEGVTAFVYRYTGAAHEFRVGTVEDADFWVYNAPSTTDTLIVTIPVNPSAEEVEEGIGLVPTETAGAFDITKATKFLWVVPFDAETPANNQGSLQIDYLKAIVVR